MINSGQLSKLDFDSSQCWSGWCDISPTQPTPLAGYAGIERLADIKATGLEANWIMFRTGDDAYILVLSVDALYSSDFFETEVVAALESVGVNLSSLWVVASHTHFAPQLDPTKIHLGRFVPKHIQEVAKKVAMSVIANLDSSPAELVEVCHGNAHACGAVHRRRLGWKLHKKPPFIRYMAIRAPNPLISISPDMRLWLLMGADGAPKAAFVHWSCHPVAAHPRDQISAAHFEVIRAALRSANSNSLPILAMSGCSGDIRPDFRKNFLPRFIPLHYPFQRIFARPTPEQIRSFNMVLATAIKLANAGMSTIGIPSDGTYIEAESELLADVNLVARSLRIGPVTFLGFNCEPSHGWVKELGYNHNDSTLAMTGYVGEVFGYLPTPEQISKGGYEVDGFRAAFNFSGDWRNAHKLSQKVRALVNKVNVV